MTSPAHSFTLRRATAADAPAVRALFCASFTATFGHLYPPDELAEWLEGCPEQRFKEECTEPDFAVMLGEQGGRLMGYCTLGTQDLEFPLAQPSWVLRQLYLDAPAKGSGLADALLEWAIAETRARGLANVYLTVWVGNRRARRFYERHGFREVGSYKFKVGSTIDDDRILHLSLDEAE
ncbi:MAG: GNAT family N-acetyltransferase [Sandaracinobacteroides sp.]